VQRYGAGSPQVKAFVPAANLTASVAAAAALKPESDTPNPRGKGPGISQAEADAVTQRALGLRAGAAGGADGRRRLLQGGTTSEWMLPWGRHMQTPGRGMTARALACARASLAPQNHISPKPRDAPAPASDRRFARPPPLAT
jgi:hypothetical protein